MKGANCDACFIERAHQSTLQRRAKLYSFNEDICKVKRWSFTKFLASVCTFLRRRVQFVLFIFHLRCVSKKEGAYWAYYTLILQTHLVNVVQLKSWRVRKRDCTQRRLTDIELLTRRIECAKINRPKEMWYEERHSHI